MGSFERDFVVIGLGSTTTNFLNLRISSLLVCYGRRFSTSAAARPPRTTGAAPPVGAGGTRGSRFFGFCARSATVQRRAKHLWSRDSAPGLKSRRQTPCKGYQK